MNTDTVATRKSAAIQYLEACPLKDAMRDMSDKMSAQIPEEMRDTFRDMMARIAEGEDLTIVAIDAVAKYFTTEEIEAMAVFYGSPVGKSIQSKMADYMATVFPAIQAKVAEILAELDRGF